MSKADKRAFRESLMVIKPPNKDGSKRMFAFGKSDYDHWNKQTMNLTDKTKCPIAYNDKYSTWGKFKETAMAFDFKKSTLYSKLGNKKRDMIDAFIDAQNA